MAKDTKGHVCRRPQTCSCSVQGLEPDERCPVHGWGEWPPRCEACGRLMPWPKADPYEQEKRDAYFGEEDPPWQDQRDYTADQ